MRLCVRHTKRTAQRRSKGSKQMTNVNLTANETAVLISVFNCHYGEDGDCVWAWAHNDSNKPHGLPKATASGVIGSLVKKGLMYSDDHGGRDDVIGLTNEGQEAARKLGA
jgi:hypothetical protein